MMMQSNWIQLLRAAVCVACSALLLLLPAAAFGGPTRVSGSLLQNTSWTADGGPYIVENMLTVPAGKVLSIGPGTLVKLSLRATIVVEGELNASGTAGSPVIFTSLKDDAAGGDTGGDGPTTAQPGDWNDIYFAPRSRGVLSYCTVRYGGSSAQLSNTSHFASANVTSENSAVVLQDCVLTDSATNGFHATYASPEVSGCVFERNGRHGLALEHSSAAVTSCIFRDNVEYGIWADDDSMAAANASVVGCSFSGNRAAMSVAPSAVPLAPGNEYLPNREGAVHVREGTLAVPSTWRKLDQPYVVTGTVVVDGKGSLSAEPGTVIKLTASGGIVVYGILQFQGQASAPIVLTSLKDDEVGGDTNSDGGASLPGPANWDGLVFALGSSGRISNCWVRYGGSARQLAPGLFAIGAVSCYTDGVTLQSCELYGNSIGVYCSGASPTVTACSIVDSREAGVRCDKGSSPKIADCEIGGRYTNPNKGITADSASLTQVTAEPLVVRNTLRGNKWAFAVSPAAMANLSPTNLVSACANGAVMLSAGQVSGSVLWPAFGGAYLLTGTVTVPSGSSLTIAPGVVAKAQQDVELIVGGALTAEGRPDARIVFTSAKDDSVAGDTNGDRSATSPEPGDWIGVTADSGTASFAFCDFSYAGQESLSGRPKCALYCRNASPAVKGCAFANNSGCGFYADAGTYKQTAPEPLISGCSFRRNTWGLQMYADSTPNLGADNTSSGNQAGAARIVGKVFTGRAHWPAFEDAYVIADKLTVAAGSELTLSGGSILKISPGNGITVNGTFTADGRPNARIVITALADDSVGGDTNMDGAATHPSGTDWLDIYFAPNSAGRLAFTDLRYGGRYDTSPLGMVTITGSSPTLEYVSVSGGFYNGIYIADGKPSLRNLTLVNNLGSGIYLGIGGAPSIRNSIICFNGSYGIYSDRPSTASVTYSCFFGNNSGAFQGVKPGEGILVVDPLLTDMEKNDLRLKPGSPAVDAGDPNDTDPWSTSRADLGAYISVKPDATPPSVPVVNVPGTYTDQTDRLSASWHAADPESGISLFRYAVGTRPGAADVVPWRDAGLSTEATIGGLALTPRLTYFVSVQAVNGAGIPSGIGSSSGVTVLIRGDLNGDGAVTTKDVSIALALALGLRPALPRELFAGDVAPVPGDGGRPFGDGRIGLNDALRILRRAAGLEPDPWP